MPIPPSSHVGKMQQAATVSTAQADAASQSQGGAEVQPEVVSAAPKYWIEKKTTLHSTIPRYHLMLQECSWENTPLYSPG